MKARIYTFTLIFGVVAAVAACGPQKKRRDPRAKDPSASATTPDGKAQTPGAEQVADQVDLPHLTDGQAVFQNACTSPVSMNVTASEKDISTDASATAGAVYDLSEAKIFEQRTLKGGEVQSVVAQVSGLKLTDEKTPDDAAAKITCHNNTALATSQPLDAVQHIPLFYNADEGDLISLARVLLQSHKGKIAGRATLAKGSATKGESVSINTQKATGGTVKTVLDNDGRIHMRVEIKGVLPDGGSVIQQYEAVYTKRQ